MNKIRQHHFGREEIKNGLFQQLGEDCQDKNLFSPLSEQERRQSLADFLAKRPVSAQAIWVFAYGSLIWNPGFDYVEQRFASIYGYHRKFCLKAYVGRGTEAHPGLLLGLDQGGSCKGMAFRIDNAKMAEELSILWDREMMGGSYRPIWLKARIEGRGIKDCISFVIRKDGSRYHASDNLQQNAKLIHEAHGPLGSCSDYVHNTHHALQTQGIHSKLLVKMHHALNALEKKQEKQDENRKT